MHIVIFELAFILSVFIDNKGLVWILDFATHLWKFAMLFIFISNYSLVINKNFTNLYFRPNYSISKPVFSKF